MSTPLNTLLHPDVRQYIKKHQKLGSKKLIGLGCTRLPEIIPNKSPAECEKNYQGLNNTTITLGRDCPAGIFSGANRSTQSGMIDIVAGRMSSVIHRELSAASAEKENNFRTSEFDRNFFADAARVYISQKTLRVDEYLGFDYKIGHNGNADTLNLSAAIVKADCTRIVGRENVRIYAGGARADNFGTFGEPRADNSDIVNPKIELIVGSKGEERLQPAVLGENLISYIKQNNKIIAKYNKVLSRLLRRVMELSMAIVPLSAGTWGPKSAQDVIGSLEDFGTLINKIMNEITNDTNHLNLAIVPGSKSILSDKIFIT
jgi:hypothetical protein